MAAKPLLSPTKTVEQTFQPQHALKQTRLRTLLLLLKCQAQSDTSLALEDTPILAVLLPLAAQSLGLAWTSATAAPALEVSPTASSNRYPTELVQTLEPWVLPVNLRAVLSSLASTLFTLGALISI
jgi:hypothetical protein